MTDPSDRPDAEEIYASNVSRGTAKNVIGAAGMTGGRHSFGQAVMRMRTEFDAIRAELRKNADSTGVRAKTIEALKAAAADARQEAEQHRIAEVACTDDLSAGRFYDLRMAAEAKAEVAEDKAKQASRRSTGEIVNERLEVMGRLSTLNQVRRQAMARAMVLVDLKGLDVPSDRLVQVVGRALDVFLDSTCHGCDGTGYFGSAYSGDRPMICRVCNGATHRRMTVGRTHDEREVGARLLSDFDASAQEAAAALRTALRR